MTSESPYPAAILAQGAALMAALTAHVQTHRGATLAAHEAGLQAIWQAFRRSCLETVVTESTTSLQPGGLPRRVRCPRCLGKARKPRWCPRTLTTTLGRVQVMRRGSAVEPAELERRLKLRGSEFRAVILTRVQGHPFALVTTPRHLLR